MKPPKGFWGGQSPPKRALKHLGGKGGGRSKAPQRRLRGGRGVWGEVEAPQRGLGCQGVRRGGWKPPRRVWGKGGALKPPRDI